MEPKNVLYTIVQGGELRSIAVHPNAASAEEAFSSDVSDQFGYALEEAERQDAQEVAYGKYGFELSSNAPAVKGDIFYYLRPVAGLYDGSHLGELSGEKAEPANPWEADSEKTGTVLLYAQLELQAAIEFAEGVRDTFEPQSAKRTLAELKELTGEKEIPLS